MCWKATDGDELDILVDLKKSGNAPFLGSLIATITEESGKVLRTEKIFLSVYTDGVRRMDLDISDMDRGSYFCDLKLIPTRDDIPDGKLIPAPEVTKKIGITKN